MEFQAIRDKLYLTKRKEDLVPLIKLWERSQGYFYFLGSQD